MKVYTRKPYRESAIPGLIATAAFLIGPAIVFYNFFIDYSNPIQAINQYGVLMLFSMVFFAFGLACLFFFFKPPKSYRAYLASITSKHYHGRLITEFEFQIPDAIDEETESAEFSTYRCYIFGRTHLHKSNEYILNIKEFNHEPISVEEFSEHPNAKVADTAPGINIKPVFFAIGFIFVGIVVLTALSYLLTR